MSAGEFEIPAGMNEVTDADGRHSPSRKAGHGSNDEKPSAATMIVEMVHASGAKLWHDEREHAYASLMISGLWQHLPIKRLRKHCAALYFEAVGKAAKAAAITDAIAVLEAQAIYDGELHEASVRLAGHKGKIYLDLADDSARVVEISTEGWRIIGNRDVPVRFVRRRGTLALPAPQSGGTLALLRPFVNVPEAQWPLVYAFLLSSLCPWHPYFVLIVEGEAGSGKSTVCRMLQMLIDPSFGELRRPPKDDRDVAIACENCLLLAYDNLSGLSPSLSDVLCTVATGGGFATRELYSDSEEALFKFRRPIMANGIDSIAARDDLADRSLVLDLPAIDVSNRLREVQLLANFEEARPQLLGALLDAVACALRGRERVAGEAHELPRMADAAIWAMAGARRVGLSEAAVLRAMLDNRAMQTEANIDADPVALGLRELARDGVWRGTPTQLLKALEAKVDETERGPRWPRAANQLKLKRRAGLMRKAGISITYEASRNKGGRIVVLSWEEPGRTADDDLA